MGGLVALLAQIPVDAMVLYEPIVLGLLRDDDPDDVAARAWDHAIVAELAERVAAGDPEAGVRRFVEAWNELRWDGLPQSVRVRLIAAAPALADEIRAGSSHAVQPEAVRWPTLILQGTLSPPVTARMTARLAAAVPVSVRRMMDGCGHMGPVQAPAQVAPAIRSFIDG
jgi:pimeloyl-ACP methyl ester carboxylesterase